MMGFFTDCTERLKADCPALLQVASGMTREAMDTMTLSHEVSALVHPLSDQADPVRTSGLIVSQGEAWTIGVMLGLTFPGGFEQWEIARAQVKGSLRGWSWGDRLAMPMAYAGGATVHYSLSANGGRWLHLLRFTLFFRETYEFQP